MTLASIKMGVNRFWDRQIWPEKTHELWIFAVNRAGFADFENAVEHVSAVNF